MAKEIKHVSKFRELHLKDKENIVSWAAGYIGKAMGTGDDKQQNGALIVTNERVSFYRKGLFGELLESIPISNVSSVDGKTNLMFSTIRITTSNNDLEFTTIEKGQYQACRDAIDNQKSQSTDQAAPIASVEKPDPIDQIKKLAELKEAGVLSESEFEAKKKQLLDNVS